MISPRPDNPDTVAGFAPIFSANHLISAQPCATRAAIALWPKSKPSTMPAQCPTCSQCYNSTWATNRPRHMGNPKVVQASEAQVHMLTGRQCKNILQRPTYLDSSNISSGIDPEVWTSKQTLQLSGKLLVLRMAWVCQCLCCCSTLAGQSQKGRRHTSCHKRWLLVLVVWMGYLGGSYNASRPKIHDLLCK